MSNGNTLQEVMETSPEDIGRGTQAMMQEEAGRVKKRLKGLKSAVTTDVSSCIKKLLYFETKYSDDLMVTNVQIDHANEILTTYSRAKIRYTNLENNIENLKMLHCETWGDNEDELDIVLEKLTKELSLYEQKFTNIAKEHDKILERYKCIALKT